MSPLMATLGLYFQIRDDYANLNLKEVKLLANLCSLLISSLLISDNNFFICVFQYAENKSFCEDLTEGKFSFPVIHTIRSHPEDKQMINILRQRTKDIEVKRHCLALMDKFGSFEYTRKTMLELDAEARRQIEILGGNPILEKVLDELKNW